MHGRLVQVEAPDPTDPTQCVMAVLKEALQQAFLDKVQYRFIQAANLPLLQLPEAKGLGSLNIGSPSFHQILEGTYLYQAIFNQYTRQLLQHLRKPPQYAEVPLQSIEDYQTGWPYSGIVWFTLCTVHGRS